jgi:hypothetical protein
VSRVPDGPTLCSKHFKEVDGALKDPDVEVEELDDVACIMCATPPNEGAVCLHCGIALHPQWHSLYCSNNCALLDV